MERKILAIHFEANLSTIGSWTIIRLPKGASAKLPSRGMTMIEGTINSLPFQAALEPDGKGSHWFRVDKNLCKAIGADVSSTIKLEIRSTDDWTEPELPDDLKKALAGSPKAHALWMKITPNAHWDWIRWIRSTREPETRKRRIKVTLSKLNAGTRRPCCFNRNLCTEPYVSKNWVLIKSPVRS